MGDPLGACRVSAAHPAVASHRQGFFHETSSRLHGCSPARSFPCLLPPGGTAALGLLPGASHPAVTSDARPGGNGSSDTDPGLPCRRQHRRPPLQEHPLNTRDLVSHLHAESAFHWQRQRPLDKVHRPSSGRHFCVSAQPSAAPQPNGEARTTQPSHTVAALQVSEVDQVGAGPASTLSSWPDPRPGWGATVL